MRPEQVDRGPGRALIGTRLPSPSAFRAWREAVPSGFTFAVKASRFLTHMKKLKEPEAPVRLLLGRARELKLTLGPVLFQLPHFLRADGDRLDRFLLALARQRLVRPLRATLEVRHPSWLEAAMVERLTRAGVALCLSDWREAPVAGPLTADFVYVRRHGATGRYEGSYEETALRADARDIRRWLRDGRDVYVYFNNDVGGHAVANARRLRALVEGRTSRQAVVT